ncbi:DUF6351 family protein [Variovorax sp. J22P240]|uniref:DUF6351 family protein n=1 Tax=Variovorax sp. J22P240 TaxID=3053514 RepID=UPI002577F7B7|nr:DUF6351 family protein [Variovorax sp. J22P240]MDL9999388.1 DUF6351 family protein [Variovorax sp. J22P240]
MNPRPGPGLRQALLATLMASLLAGGLASCGGGGNGSAFMVPPPAAATPQPPATGGGSTNPIDPIDPTGQTPVELKLTTLSSRPDLVSGGDTLVEVEVPNDLKAADVKVLSNGNDVTAMLEASTDGRKLRGLVSGLAVGANKLVAQVGPDKAYGELAVTNHPITGPMFSGPQLSPFECRTSESGLGAPLDASCSVNTRLEWFYFTSAGVRQSLTDPFGPRPADIANATTIDGKTVPFIVRVESGTINRSIYRIAVLDDPAVPGQLNSAGWNRRVVFRFGESTAAQYNQGSNSVTDAFKSDAVDQQSIKALERGFAYVVSTLNINKVNVNDVVAAETATMIREHIAKTYGVPRWMVGMGGSGGAIQQMLIAQNYPGILDGIMPDAAFPDVFGTAMAVSDCRLLNRYFAANPASSGARKAFEGHMNTVCANWDAGNGNAILATNGAVSPACGLNDSSKVYNTLTNPAGARCTVYDINVNSLGRDPATGFVRRPLDNVGVQYGLDGLRKGLITATQFLDLNENIGGYDADGNIVKPQRTVADAEGLTRAYELGRIGSGSGGLATVPILSVHPYAEPGGDIHTIYNDIKIREQLMKANGRADNQVIWLFPNPQLAQVIGKPAQVLPLSLLLRDLMLTRLTLMTTWLDGITADPAALTADKVALYKPADAVDSCWDVNDGTRYKEVATLNGSGMCNTLYPKTPAPRMVAGGPASDDVLKCQLKPLDDADYAPVVLTGPEKLRLQGIFAQGVCDFGKPGVGQAKLKGTWLKY